MGGVQALIVATALYLMAVAYQGNAEVLWEDLQQQRKFLAWMVGVVMLYALHEQVPTIGTPLMWVVVVGLLLTTWSKGELPQAFQWLNGLIKA